jgi:creatinine amidohydrolase
MADKAFVLAEMSWPEVKEALKTVEVAIIPTGSNEQHGPNIAESSDIALATAGARNLARRLYPRAILAPSLPFGVSPHHMRFPGTISLRPETFIEVLRDVVGSLQKHGLQKFFILNGHGGNMATLNVVTWKLRQELGVKVAYALHWPSPALIDKYQRSPRIGHACEIETSLAMHLTPNIAKTEALTKGQMLGPAFSGGMDAKTNDVITANYFDEVTANGALGDATYASAEAGKEMAQEIENRLTGHLEKFLAEKGI